jgi:hypothetical protein
MFSFIQAEEEEHTDIIIGVLGIDILEQIVVVGLSLILSKTKVSQSEA